MQIQHDEHGKKGAFYIEENGEWIAEMTYFHSAPGIITVDHTEVDEKLRGEGIGEDLVKTAVEYARANNLKIRPVCPYTRKVIEKTPEYQDIVAK
jgi:predicted GNAT family acetyltransferase